LRALRELLGGGALGAAVGALGVGYAHLAHSRGWFDVPPTAPPHAGSAFLLLAVVAAPLIEGVIFPGLPFQRLGRAVAPELALVWSAALFAVMHPMPAWPPVFLLGVAAALAFRATRFLPAAMAVHAVYNLVVVTFE